ncbi:phosphotransferase [Sedimentibacter hydroxybenzoicus DSM 7310]|uniref:Phosphotransferase n=1 Tax=Sedimentibacter hydroxybenzoicus DSM 7310 TaxID=1123245 RepID=A0A974BM31_SEDHY|nr:phosphotransferase [Sedimentibacter hydroxybenzoicus]NYB75899.1 phosphotransferase [Sedimentibacter hydroxybenzoicus DSM 7310]
MQIMFEKICKQFDLGTLKSTPTPLAGGFMHKMYSMFTTTGNYAVKLLNPYVMQRETAKENYRKAEYFESILEKHSIPILPALVFHGQKMQEIDGQFFYVFNWYDGKALKGNEIKEHHCIEIGNVLARIHNLDTKKSPPYKRDEIHIDWNFYINKMKHENKELYELLRESCHLFYDSQEKGNKAIKSLDPILSICHNDMDSKNVLWNDNNYRIIDLECLSHANPSLELFELALCWSGYEDCNIDFNLFRKLIDSYLNAGGIKPQNWENLYDSNYGRLQWLEYNIKRVLGIDCGADEKEMGISEVKDTVAHVIYYHNIKENILNMGF